MALCQKFQLTREIPGHHGDGAAFRERSDAGRPRGIPRTRDAGVGLWRSNENFLNDCPSGEE